MADGQKATEKPAFFGSIPALVTPMSADGDVDFAVFERFVNWQITEGSTGLVPVGTTGESPTLTHTEHMELVRRCVDVASGRVPVIAGTGSNSSREAIALTQAAEKAGADAALVVTPYYNKPNAAGLLAHFRAVHDASGLPIIVYNIPGRSVIDVEPSLMGALAGLERIIGVKDATGDLARTARQRQAAGPGFIQLSGEDATALGFNAMGGSGCISVTANIAPSLCAAMQRASLGGDHTEAIRLQDLLLPLHTALFSEPSPAPAKAALAMLGVMSDRVRLPLLPMSDQGRIAVKSALDHAGISAVDLG